MMNVSAIRPAAEQAAACVERANNGMPLNLEVI